MPTQRIETPLELSDMDRMLARLLLVAELLLNPTINPTDPDSQSSETTSKSSQESSAAEADV